MSSHAVCDFRWSLVKDVPDSVLVEVAQLFERVFGNTTVEEELQMIRSCDTIGIARAPVARHVVRVSGSPTTLFGAIVMDEQHIRTICVNEKYQRDGIGTYMMYRTIERYGRQPITLNIERRGPDADKLRKFYERFGFKLSGLLDDNRERWVRNVISDYADDQEGPVAKRLNLDVLPVIQSFVDDIRDVSRLRQTSREFYHYTDRYALESLEFHITSIQQFVRFLLKYGLRSNPDFKKYARPYDRSEQTRMISVFGLGDSDDDDDDDDSHDNKNDDTGRGSYLKPVEYKDRKDPWYYTRRYIRTRLELEDMFDVPEPPDELHRIRHLTLNFQKSKESGIVRLYDNVIYELFGRNKCLCPNLQTLTISRDVSEIVFARCVKPTYIPWNDKRLQVVRVLDEQYNPLSIIADTLLVTPIGMHMGYRYFIYNWSRHKLVTNWKFAPQYGPRYSFMTEDVLQQQFNTRRRWFTSKKMAFDINIADICEGENNAQTVYFSQTQFYISNLEYTDVSPQTSIEHNQCPNLQRIELMNCGAADLFLYLWLKNYSHVECVVNGKQVNLRDAATRERIRTTAQAFFKQIREFNECLKYSGTPLGRMKLVRPDIEPYPYDLNDLYKEA